MFRQADFHDWNECFSRGNNFCELIQFSPRPCGYSQFQVDVRQIRMYILGKILKNLKHMDDETIRNIPSKCLNKMIIESQICSIKDYYPNIQIQEEEEEQEEQEEEEQIKTNDINLEHLKKRIDGYKQSYIDSCRRGCYADAANDQRLRVMSETEYNNLLAKNALLKADLYAKKLKIKLKHQEAQFNQQEAQINQQRTQLGGQSAIIQKLAKKDQLITDLKAQLEDKDKIITARTKLNKRLVDTLILYKNMHDITIYDYKEIKNRKQKLHAEFKCVSKLMKLNK